MEEICAVSEEIEREAHVAIGMENLFKESEDILTEIEGKLKSLSPLSSKCSIYRVPEILREINSKAYTPKVVSIGPFHHGKEHLQVMEEHKWRYLDTFLKRIKPKLSLEDYFEVGKQWEEEARHCYAETIELNSDNFVKMMLVDGSFIVECLLRKKFLDLLVDGSDLVDGRDGSDLVDGSDRLFYKPWLRRHVTGDMLLLENQLPYFVVEGLFKLVSKSICITGRPSFLELVKEFFVEFSITAELPDVVSNPEIHHFVDFIRYSYLQSFMEEGCQDEKAYCFPPTVSQLHEAGIKFKTKTNCSSVGIELSNGTLEIPQLLISDSTETLLRNLIAFEDCHCPDGYRHFINYMQLLYDMIKTTKDVDLLIHHKILGGLNSSREYILRIFENIVIGVSVPKILHWNSLSESLNAYCRTPSNRLKATLKRDYLNTIFNTPWKVLSVILALVILILTIIQTLCSLRSL